MLVFFYSLIIFLAASGGEGGFTGFYNRYLNIPGFEAWKFINLAIFVAVAIYIGRKKLGPKFIAKRDQIRSELIKAETEKQAALAKLTTTEGKLAQLETERAEILQKARDETAFEKNRLAEQTRAEIERLKKQSGDELSRLGKQTYVGLRRFSAEESIRLAEQKLRSQIDAAKDAELVRAGLSEIRGLK